MDLEIQPEQNTANTPIVLETAGPQHERNTLSSVGPVIALIIIIFVVILGGLYLWGSMLSVEDLAPAPQTIKIPEQRVNSESIPIVTDETADWKTYTNTQYGFSFKYPSSFLFYLQGISISPADEKIARERCGSGGSGGDLIYFEDTLYKYNGFDFVIDFDKKCGKYTQWTKTTTLKIGPHIVVKKDNIVESEHYEGFVTNSQWTVVHNGTTYGIQIDEPSDADLKLVEEIISSLIFLN